MYVLTHAIIFLVGIIIVLTNPNNVVLTAIGTSVIATGCSGWAIAIYIHLTQKNTTWIQNLAPMGFINAFMARSAPIKPEYASRLERASSQIDIMGFGLRTLNQDFSADFLNWSKRANVRILLLDPTFPNPNASYAGQRDREEGNTPGTIEDDVKLFLEKTLPVLGPSFQVRLYRCLPAVNLFRIDNEAFWGPYLMQVPSRNTPTFIVASEGALFPVLLEHFDKIWNNDDLSRAV